MRKVIYLVAASLDGKIARPDHSFDCFLPEGEHVADYLEMLQTSFDDVLMGRRTYEAGLRAGVTDPYPHLKSYVFTTAMKESPNERVLLVPGKAIEFVEALKSQPGRDIYLCGGAELASTLLEAKLIDEIVVKLNPLLIGEGISLFSRVARPLDLELLQSKIYENGVLLLTYRVKGDARSSQAIPPAPLQ